MIDSKCWHNIFLFGFLDIIERIPISWISKLDIFSSFFLLIISSSFIRFISLISAFLSEFTKVWIYISFTGEGIIIPFHPFLNDIISKEWASLSKCSLVFLSCFVDIICNSWESLSKFSTCLFFIFNSYIVLFFIALSLCFKFCTNFFISCSFMFNTLLSFKICAS